jgi:hypothetical protein
MIDIYIYEKNVNIYYSNPITDSDVQLLIGEPFGRLLTAVFSGDDGDNFCLKEFIDINLSSEQQQKINQHIVKEINILANKYLAD